MKRVLRLFGFGLAVLVLAAGGFYVWAWWASDRALSRHVDTHTVEFPIPFPAALTGAADTATGREASGAAGEDARPAGLARAVERGRHLVEARYGCNECHGSDLGGGVMVDAFPLGTLLGPNITSGTGSVALDYTSADWDRIVRHGVRQDGTASTMPAQDFQRMSDRELSDIVAYIESVPPVDREVPAVRLGPLGKVLVATGQLPLAADLVPSHHEPHPLEPPAAEPTVEFGRHLAATCVGCHGADLAGGRILGGDPSWPPAANLTPHPDALGDWRYEDFVTALRGGVRPDGTRIRMPMTLVVPKAQRMSDVEFEALWAYLQSIPAVAGGE